MTRIFFFLSERKIWRTTDENTWGKGWVATPSPNRQI